MKRLKCVLIMAGGTGGHVFPGLAVARQLSLEGVDVHWLGTQKGLESRVVREAGFPIHFISINGLRGKGIKDILLAPWRLLVSVLQSLSIMRCVKPDVVLGMGGFVSGPGGVASWLLRCPLIIHEQNAQAGLTNKLLSYFAIKVLEGFPNTFSNSVKVVATGNPVRDEIAAIEPPAQRFQDRKQPWRLLVLGGSLGAVAINDLVPQALAKLPKAKRPEVYHQTGEKHLTMALDAYTAAQVKAKVVPFITDIEKAYAWADIVLCRAGASTIAELCVVGVGSVLIPYPYAVDDHQTKNAKYLVNQEAAILIQQNTLTIDGLAEVLSELGLSPAKRLMMAQAAYALRQVDATHKVLITCQEICS